MGIFETTREVTPEETGFQTENLKRLKNEFDVTKAMGVKKYPDAIQFIYDEKRRCFVVVEGPEETFKVKNPYIVDFDQVDAVFLEVEEYWTKSDNKFDHAIPAGQKELSENKYDKVFWRYNLLMHIQTSHPYVGNIKYEMNYHEINLRFDGFHISVPPRGLELNGMLTGYELQRASERITKFAEEQQRAVEQEHVIDIMKEKKSGGLIGSIVKDVYDDKYVKRIKNISKHLDRAFRISKVLGKV